MGTIALIFWTIVVICSVVFIYACLDADERSEEWRKHH